MEVDFPTSREEFRRQTGYEFPFSTDDEVSIMENATTDGSHTGSFMGWPSKSSAGGSIHEKDRPAKSNHSGGSFMRVLTKPQRAFRRKADNSTSDREAGERTGGMTVEFPEDRGPFRRKSHDSYHSTGSLSGYGAGGSAGRSNRTGNGSGDESLKSREASRTSGELRSSVNSSGSRTLRSSLNSTGGHSVGRERARRRRQDSWGSLRRSMGERDECDERPTRGRSRSRDMKMVRRPSLTQLHDDNVGALPILGWDKESDSDCSSLHGRSRKGYLSRSSRSGASVTPAPLTMMPPQSLRSSLNEAQFHSKGLIQGEFRTRESFNRENAQAGQSIGPDVNDVMMVQDEVDQKKPWLKAPPGSVPMWNRRATGNTMSSFASDMMDAHDVSGLQAAASSGRENPQSAAAESALADDKPPTDCITAKTAPTEEVSAAVAAERDATLRGSMSEGDTLRTSKTQESVTSSLGEDDDGSELTELLQAQEALFPGSGGGKPESVDGSERSAERREMLPAPLDKPGPASDAGETDNSSTTALARGSRRDLSSLDIVHEERHYHEEQPEALLPSSAEHTKHAPGPELEDLPSSARNDPFRKPRRSSTKADDDSVSYSDIDGEQNGDVAPSIKMCMSVRDAAIEREFATEELDDVEFSEEKSVDSRDVENPFDDSRRSDDEPFIRKKSSRLGEGAKHLRESLVVQTAKLDTKSTKRLRRWTRKRRRTNKRLYKRVAWNCRKITICVTFSLSILIGVAALAWWATSKSTESGSVDSVEGGTSATDESMMGSTLTPSGPSNNLQWPPAATFGSIPPPNEALSQHPSSSPSSTQESATAVLLPTAMTNYELPPTTTAPQAVPTALPSTLASDNQGSLASSQPSPKPSYSPTYSFFQSESPSEPSIQPSSSLSSSNTASPTANGTLSATAAPPTNMTNATSMYTSFQTISGSTEDYAGSSVSITPTGEFFAVGSKEADGPDVERTGLVRVYQRNEDGKYLPLGADSMFGSARGDEFGASVSIANEGRRVAVGARSASTNGLEKNGEVKVFEYSEIFDAWAQIGSSIQGSEDRDRLGFSVSLTGDGQRVAVGAPRGNEGRGSATVYDFNEVGWMALEDAAIGSDVDGRAGFSVSLSNDGTTLAVGSFRALNSNLTKSGSVSVYKVNGTSLIDQGQTLYGASANDQFGYSVSLSGDGQRLIVGANGFDEFVPAKGGLCEVFDLRTTRVLGSFVSRWISATAVTGVGGYEEAGLDVSMSPDGTTASCSEKGAVTIIQETGDGWDVVETIASSQENTESFGFSVSLSQNGTMAIVGAPSYNSSAGFVELFG